MILSCTCMAQSAMELQLGVINRSLPTTHAETKANKMLVIFMQMCALVLSTMQLFTLVCFCAQTTEVASDTHTWRITVILIVGKTWIPSIGAHTGWKILLTSCISGLNLVGYTKGVWNWRGYCTPNQKLPCFVLSLKIINTFLKINISIL